jgi:transposase
MNPHEKRLADKAYEARIQQEEQARKDAMEAWQRQQLDPVARLIGQVAALRQRTEALELEVARLSFLLERKEP